MTFSMTTVTIRRKVLHTLQIHALKWAALYIFITIPHFAGEPEGGNGLPSVFRFHVELATKHFDNSLAEGA